ncbi:calcium-binding protein 8 isoform X4 [Saccopteryx bilineata]|uniref:calcium-binding protein 8 isoform X4 n=1 Tax=Saccopteryx bilineata TaxID=59482 RepID=UPI00338F07FD
MRLPEQPGEGKPENEEKGGRGAPGGGEETPRSQAPDFPTWEKMPFHHVTAGLLYKGNYLNRSLSAGSDSEQLANISVEELDEIREAFRVLDRDGNGFISKQELGMAMRSLGYMPSEVELAIIMQRLDMDVRHAEDNSGGAEAHPLSRLPGPLNNEGHREHHHQRGGEPERYLGELPDRVRRRAFPETEQTDLRPEEPHLRLRHGLHHKRHADCG